MTDLNKYIDTQLDEFREIMNYQNYKLYEYLYQDVPITSISELFTRMHSGFNYIFKFLNSKNNSFSGDGYYNAEESRKLIYLIEFYKIIKVNLMVHLNKNEGIIILKIFGSFLSIRLIISIFIKYQICIYYLI